MCERDSSGYGGTPMPRIEMTRGARIALLVLRVYLVGMLLLILLKFLRISG
jgi:hypothetical protein